MHTSTWRMAWRNLGRNRKRTGLAILAIAVGQFALLASNGMMHGYADNIRLAITGPMIGHVQIHAASWREDRAMDRTLGDLERTLTTIRADEAVRNAAPRIYAPVLAAPRGDAFAAVVVGVDVAGESADYGMLSGLSGGLEPGQVLIGYRLARRMQAEVDQEIAIVGQGADGSIANDLYRIRDIIKCPADLVNQSGVVMPLAAAQRLFVLPNQAHEIVIRTRQSGRAEALVKRLSAEPILAGTEIVTWQEVMPQLSRMLGTVDYVGYIVLGLVLIAAVAGIANTLMMATFERLHEFGMLLALGTRPGRLVGMIMAEAVMLGIVGVLVGSLLGFGFVAITSHTGVNMASWGGENNEMEDLAFQGLNLPLLVYPRLEGRDVVMGLVAVALVSLAASLWPASIAARLEPMEAMRA